tara:strand:+ start:55 stop:249 length:195 start_codon:yes stop_codon:yes gene_type:complete
LDKLLAFPYKVRDSWLVTDWDLGELVIGDGVTTDVSEITNSSEEGAVVVEEQGIGVAEARVVVG